MISECMNEECRRPLHYLRDGRVIRIVRYSEAGEIYVEHFWLCGDCFLSFDFHFSQDGAVSVARRAVPAAQNAPDKSSLHLTLVA